MPRTAARIVFDARGELPPDHPLVNAEAQSPLLISARHGSPETNVARLRAAGAEVLVADTLHPAEHVLLLLAELGRRRMTNVLVEGGGALLGSFLTAGQIDEVHVFIAPKIIGGQSAPGPIGGEGVSALADALELPSRVVEVYDEDIYLHGRVRRK